MTGQHCIAEPETSACDEYCGDSSTALFQARFNHDAGCFFSAMYRGLRDLMGSKVDWKVTRMTAADLPDPLFDFERYRRPEVYGIITSQRGVVEPD